MELRTIAGSTSSLSVVGIALRGGRRPFELEPAPQALGLARKAARAGVSFVEATRLADVGAALRLAGAMSPPRGRVCAALDVGPSAQAGLPGTPPLESERLGILPMVRDPSWATIPSTAFAERIQALVRELGAPCWGVAWSSAATARAELPLALDAGARLIALPVNLRSFTEAEEATKEARAGGASVIGLDPFDGGSLDGSFLEPSIFPLEGPSRPPSVADLSQRLAPVTRLGFLTERRKRTLAQAAVRFVLDLPGVVSVACELRTPRTIDELAEIDRVPSLTAEERGRLAQPADAGGRVP